MDILANEPTTEELLVSLELHHSALKSIKATLASRFKETVEKALPIGTIVDVTLPGPAHRAEVAFGRGYGKKFRIESILRVNVEVNHPISSTWFATAISVRDDGTTLGNPLQLRGNVYDYVTRSLSPAELLANYGPGKLRL
jgi:hypothetical protein